MSEDKLKQIKKLLQEEGEGETSAEGTPKEEAPAEAPAEEKPAEEDSKVSVDAAAVADRIAEKIAKAIAESKDATSEKDAEDMRKHLFQSSDGKKSDHGLDLRKMKLDDFDIKTVEEAQERYAGQKVVVSPYRLGHSAREMETPAAVRVLGFFKALLDRDVVSIKALAEGTDSQGGYEKRLSGSYYAH